MVLEGTATGMLIHGDAEVVPPKGIESEAESGLEPGTSVPADWCAVQVEVVVPVTSVDTQHGAAARRSE